MVRKIYLILGFITLTNAYITIEVNNPNPAFDLELYENVLDADECIKQIDIVQSNTLLWLQCKYHYQLILSSCILFYLFI